jgi:hypothetical protein
MQPAEGENEVALELLLAANEGKCTLENIAELRDALRSLGAEDVIEYLLDQVWELEPKL